MTSPTELSLRLLRGEGWTVDVCERWVPMGSGKVRKDLFGLVDLVAVRPGQTMGVQTTSSTNYHSRLNKLIDAEHLPAVLALRAAGWTIVIHGWRKTTRAGHACQHGRVACGCTWQLHHHTSLMEASV
jgi:hypothetical protein